MVQQLQKAYPNVQIEICLITLENYKKSIDKALLKSGGDKQNCVFLNLCDGIETDGYPGTLQLILIQCLISLLGIAKELPILTITSFNLGVSIVDYLESEKLPFTGAGTTFYINSTSKTLLKNLMLGASVPTLPFVVVNPDSLAKDLAMADKVVGYPLIIKPSVSYGSMMISTKSVVDSSAAAATYINTLTDYKDEIFLEAFLAGN